MVRGEHVSEDDRSGETSGDLDEVERQLADIRASKRNRVRWRMSRHTAELALRALSDEKRFPHRPSTKSRRRKRRKRLL
jgi:hypothetical protein